MNGNYLPNYHLSILTAFWKESMINRLHLKSTIDPEVKGKVDRHFVKVNIFLQSLISILRLDKLPPDSN